MFAALGHVVMKPFMLAWLYSSQHSWQGLPLPEPGPPVVVDGSNLQRVLLCGSGIVVGYGVTSHELGLGGSLARSLAVLTGRGVEVSTIAGPRLSAKSAQSQLSAEVLAGMDAVVLSFGTFDVLTFRPAKSWGSSMSKLVDSVLVHTPSNVRVFVVDCTTPMMSHFTAGYRRHLARMTTAYNEEIRALTQQRERVHHLHFAPEPEEPDAIEGRQSYRAWADSLAPGIAEGLRGHHSGD